MKKALASLRYIVPSDMEYFLEQSAEEGRILQSLGEKGLFYFEFTEEKPQKTCFVVDYTALPKQMYIRTLIEQDWELMGSSMNCYIWRKTYSGKRRPEDFSDKQALRTHCIRLGIGFGLVGLLLLAVSIWAFTLYFTTRKMGQNLWNYFLMGAVQFPCSWYFFWAFRKLMKEAGRLSEVISRGTWKSQTITDKNDEEELSFIREKEKEK